MPVIYFDWNQNKISLLPWSRRDFVIIQFLIVHIFQTSYIYKYGFYTHFYV
jgi:hypothetical protein